MGQLGQPNGRSRPRETGPRYGGSRDPADPRRSADALDPPGDAVRSEEGERCDEGPGDVGEAAEAHCRRRAPSAIGGLRSTSGARWLAYQRGSRAASRAASACIAIQSADDDVTTELIT